MYGSQSTISFTAIHLFLFSGFSNVCHSACVWPTALKLGSVTNFDTLFLVIGFISLVDEIQFMLISSRHICLRSIGVTKISHNKVQNIASYRLFVKHHLDQHTFGVWRMTPNALKVSYNNFSSISGSRFPMKILAPTSRFLL